MWHLYKRTADELEQARTLFLQALERGGTLVRRRLPGFDSSYVRTHHLHRGAHFEHYLAGLAASGL